ncbi:MAG TPA: phosphotransferase family protein [Pseudomonadales bacterium]|nr:phosphotransferase family protein [Pseudomonadales bacterium]
MARVDEAGKIREGEELDVNAVDAFLKKNNIDVQGTLSVKQFPGGASNLTYLLRYDNVDFILRRPPFGRKAKSAHDMAREAKVLQALKPVYPYVPTVVALCQDEAVMGCDFYVMERLNGFIIRKDFPQDMTLSAEQARKLCFNLFDRMIELHQVDVEKAGLTSLGKGEGYVKRQIEGWNARYRQARTDDVPDCESVMSWLQEKMPEKDVAIRMIHNDYKMDNVVVNPDDPTQVIGVLDWEMATLGDPMMDFGIAISYWVQSDDDAFSQATRLQPSNYPGMPTRAELIAYYSEKTGWRVDNFDFYFIFGLFRLAVIAQQIYYRFYHGQTKDQRFGGFRDVVRALEQRCLKLIAASRL